MGNVANRPRGHAVPPTLFFFSFYATENSENIRIGYNFTPPYQNDAADEGVHYQSQTASYLVERLWTVGQFSG